MKHILEADSIQLEFDNRKILSDIYLKFETGKITGLVGRNGQGKTCLMQIIYGSLNCEKSIRIDKINQPTAFQIPELIKYLPQFNFIPKRLSLKRIFNDFELEYSVFEKRFPEFAAKYNSPINNLSGGEYRLVELYILLKSKSQFVLLDEPFTHLNPLQIEKVIELLKEEKSNKGILLTDHMFDHVTEICDTIYLLANGKTHFVKNMEEIEKLGYVNS